MISRIYCIALLLCCSTAFAAEPKVTVAETPVKKDSFGKVTVEIEKGDQVAFQVFPTPTKRDAVGNVLYINGPAGTKYTILVTVVNFGDDGGKKRFDTGQIDLPIEGNSPTPPGPGPPPGPSPEPDPFASKSENPFGANAGSLRVLVIYDKMMSAKLTRDQLNTIYGQDFYDYLNSKCGDGVGGKKTWRIWGHTENADADEDPVWSKAMKRGQKTLPWIIIGNGKNGFEGPLPETKDGIMSLIKKYGG